MAKIKRRARTKKGRFVPDDPSTVKNEYWEYYSILDCYRQTMKKYWTLY
tara:strand:- start:417 stop:563 length:147 start_codon:yes stop_codon:yes gene_type:complete